MPAEPASIIAERYRVQAVLGRGGMAVVYDVYDTVRDRRVALKRLLARNVSDAHVARLFEFEYHALSQLAHPCIVEVYDYASDAEGPFYTMELLTGGDLRLRSPLSWRETCKLLADVCSALSLMHSRRYVHRDLTPLNVRCTADGRAKLFDFGSMTQFGRVKHVVGTPPFVAPEAINGQSLDGQTDLYSLGATAYYALTRRHAYHARTLAELPELWASPPPVPSTFALDIPPALDTLVMALLNQTPSARPGSAAEVMERLAAIGGFELQEAMLVSHSYLSTPLMVGRDVQLGGFTRRLARLSAGQGAAIYLAGRAGSGRSRLLDACALQAKLARTLVVRVHARVTGTQRWAGVGVVLEDLLPQHTGLVADQIPRGELQTKLRELLRTAAQQRPVVIVVDDMEHLDEPSAAFFALLAQDASTHPILLLAAAEADAGEGDVRRAVQLYASAAKTFPVADLDPIQSDNLVVSLFGTGANVRRLAARLFDLTRGNPAQIMRIAHHLVQRDICRYAGGSWTVPSSIDVDELAAALRETIDLGLSDSALQLARTLALAELPQTTFDECLQLSSHQLVKQLHADLQSLIQAGVVNVDDGVVTLSRPSLVSVLLAGVPTDERRQLHLRVAGILEHRRGTSFLRVQQLLYAGQPEQSLDLHLAELQSQRGHRLRDPSISFEYLQGLPKNWADTYHALIAACASSGRSRQASLLLQIELLAYATLSARFEGDCLLEVAAQLRHDCGLDLVAELSGRVPAGELLSVALTKAQERYDAMPEHARGLAPISAMTALAQLTIQAIGMAGRTFDIDLLLAMPSLAPLTPLSPALAVVEQNLRSTLEVMSGKSESARLSYIAVARRVAEPDGAGLEETHRFHVRAAALWAAGMIEAAYGRQSTLERAAEIEGNPLFAVSALRLRMLHALAIGDCIGAERLRGSIELSQIQNSPPQLFEGTQAMQATFGYEAVGDLIRVKECLVDVEAMAHDHEGWRPVLHSGRGAYQSLRGDHALALVELERGLTTMTPSHLCWASCAALLVWALIHLERFESAVARAVGFLEDAQTIGREQGMHLILIPLAFAEARIGSYDTALVHIEDAIEILSAEGGSGVQLGRAYEVRAYLALHLADQSNFSRYADACRAQYGLGNSPVLLERHRQLLGAAHSAGLVNQPERSGGADSIARAEHAQSTVLTLLRRATDASQRKYHCLQLLSQATGAESALLYLIKAGSAVLSEKLCAGQLPLELDGLVTQFLNDTIEDEHTTQTGTSPDAVSLNLSTSAFGYTPMLLSHAHEAQTIVTGVVLISLGAKAVMRVPTELLRALSKLLFDAGDTERYPA